MVDCFFYIGILLLTCFSIKIVCIAVTEKELSQKIYFSKKNLIIFFFLISPIIVLYTFRYGIGTDYYTYRTIFSNLHVISFSEYVKLHSQNIGLYYVEPAYYILNRYLSFTYGSLLFVVSLILFGFVYYGTLSIDKYAKISFTLFIYFCTQFIYSMNGVRFSIAISIVFFGVQFIIKKKLLKWIVCVLLATGFHKTSLICIPLYFLCDIENTTLSKFRNNLWYVLVLFFPVIAKPVLNFVGNMSFFNRYFSHEFYKLGDFHFNPMFLFHIIPVILPLFIVKKRFLLHDKKSMLLLRIVLFEIPLRELGSMNTFLSRLARFPQMIQVVLVPYVVSSVKDPRLKVVLKLYYLAWYIFYFIYVELVVDRGDSIPYHSILFNGGNW